MLDRYHNGLRKYGIAFAAVLLLAYGTVKITSFAVAFQSPPIPPGGKTKAMHHSRLFRTEGGAKERLVIYPHPIKADQVFSRIEKSKIWKKYDLLEENEESIKFFNETMGLDTGLPDLGLHDGVASHIYYSRNEKYFLTVIVSDREIYYQVFRRDKRVQDNYYNMMRDIGDAIK